nr:ribonuclease H-like domain-containing protein [Tanacetum cinerariifolium]
MMSSVKLPILKKGKYILWTMKMEHYLAHTDYALWEVILNGNSVVQMTKDKAGNEIEVPLVTAQQILARIRERKAKSTLLMAIPDKHLARFHRIKDAKTLWAAIKTRFADLYLKPRATYLLIMRNKPGIDNLDIDDMYNNLIVYETDIKGSSRSSSNSPNVAFISAKSTSSANELNASYNVSTATCHSSQVNSGPLLEFQRTLTLEIRPFFRRLTSRSMISTGSLTKCSLSSTWISSSGIARGSSAKHFFKFET